MQPDDERTIDSEGPDDGDLDPREEARIHRRDHDAEAHRRDLMRPGMGKVFKQITDTWARDSRDVPGKRHSGPRQHER